MKEQVDFSSAEKKVAEIRGKQRDFELAKQRKRRELNRAIITLGVLESELTDTNSGQAEHFVELEVEGLDQAEGESNQELFERAVRICRTHGLSAEEVAAEVKNLDSRLKTAYNLGSIDEDERGNVISRLSSQIAKVYRSSTESK